MKSFIVAALLVAAVAGQSMDLVKYQKEYNPLYKYTHKYYPVGEEYNQIDNYYNYDNIVGDYDYTTKCYTVEELMELPLFREYMNLPLFRQYWSYPVFQRYVASVYFQRFWQIPTFQQYFVNPMYFYKYIYPIVQLFKYEVSTMNTYTHMFNKFGYPYKYDTEYGYDNLYYAQQRDLVNQFVPRVCQINTVYCKALLEKFYIHFQTMQQYYGQEETTQYYPTTETMYKYNPYLARMFNKYPTTVETEMMTPYTFNKERMFNLINKERMFNTEKVHFNKFLNTIETPRYVEHLFTPTMKVEHMRPVMKTLEKIIPETLIKA